MECEGVTRQTKLVMPEAEDDAFDTTSKKSGGSITIDPTSGGSLMIDHTMHHTRRDVNRRNLMT